MNMSNSSPDLSPSKELAPNKSLINRFQAKRTRKNYNAVQANSTFGQDLACMEASRNDDRFAALSKKVSGARKVMMSEGQFMLTFRSPRQLNKFKKQHRKKSQTTTHQFDWRREQVQLKEVEKKASRMLETCMTSLFEIINGEEEADTDVNFIAEASGAKNDLDRSAGESFKQREKYTTRLSELRNVLLVVRTSGDEEDGERDSPETTEKETAAKNLIKPLFAEVRKWYCGTSYALR